MIVTDLEYALEKRLVDKIDIMIARCTHPKVRRDAVFIVEGGEGEGKTNSSLAIGYYAKYKMKRELHMFFRLQPMMEFAQSTEEKIIIWDEPALDSLSTDWYKDASKDLIRLMMLCRKKRHFFIFNFVFFKNFNKTFVRRALGMIHMYSRRQIIPGRFFYIKKAALFKLYKEYDKIYDSVYKKHKAFGGNFPIVEKHLEKMGLTIDGHPNATLEHYESLKDKAILSIGKKGPTTNKEVIKYIELKKKLGSLVFPITTKEKFASDLGLHRTTLNEWRHIGDDNYRKRGGSVL